MAQAVVLAHEAAAEILEAFTLYQRSFKRITRCAQGHFEQHDWHGQERDSVARLDLYKRVVDRSVYDVRNLLGPRTRAPGASGRRCGRRTPTRLPGGWISSWAKPSSTRSPGASSPRWASTPASSLSIPTLRCRTTPVLLRHPHLRRPSPFPTLIARLLDDCSSRSPFRDLHARAARRRRRNRARTWPRSGATGV